MAQRFYLFAKLRLYRTRAKGTQGTAQRNDAMLYGRWDWAVSESATGAGTGTGSETETGVSSWGLASTGVIKTLAQVRGRGGEGRGEKHPVKLRQRRVLCICYACQAVSTRQGGLGVKGGGWHV